MTLCLTPAELLEITGYQRGHDQLRYFKTLGVPAHRRPDGTVSVCRQHFLELRRVADNAPQPTHSRPRLRSDGTQAPQKGLRKTRLALVR